MSAPAISAQPPQARQRASSQAIATLSGLSSLPGGRPSKPRAASSSLTPRSHRALRGSKTTTSPRAAALPDAAFIKFAPRPNAPERPQRMTPLIERRVHEISRYNDVTFASNVCAVAPYFGRTPLPVSHDGLHAGGPA